MDCPQCHQVNKEGARFCRACGFALTSAAAPAAPQAAPQPPIAPAAPAAPQAVPQPPAAQDRAQQHRAGQRGLWIGAVISFVALFFEWTPGRASVNSGGILYIRGSISDYAPQYGVSITGGQSGLEAGIVLPLLFIGWCAYRYRDGQWPRWARNALAGVTLWLGFGLLGLFQHFAFGPLLYWVGYGMMAWTTWQIFQRR